METVTKIFVFLVLFGIYNTHALTGAIYDQGNNVKVSINKTSTDENKTLEINFSGFTSNLHYTTVMMYDPRNIFISRNYTERIQNITSSQDTFSFLLLNVSFIDSGNFTVYEHSQEKGKTSIIVIRRRLIGQNNEMMILSFMYNNVKTSSIKIHGPSSDNILIIYDVEQTKCNYHGQAYASPHLIESCALNKWNFCLTFRELTFLQKGGYTSWDDKGFLLDSIFVDVRDDNTSSTQITNGDLSSSCITDSPKDEENRMTLWYLISLGVVLNVAAFLTIIIVRKIRQRKVPKTTNYFLTRRNKRQNTTNRSRNGCQNLAVATSPKECRMNWAQKVHKKSSSRVDPSTLYAKVNKKRAMDNPCTYPSVEYSNCSFTSELTHSGSFQVEVAGISTSDLKRQDESIGGNYEVAGNVCDDSSAMERVRHMVSQTEI